MVVISTPFSAPTEGIRHQQPFTTLFIGNREVGKGTIFITESQLTWADSCSGKGFSLEYPHIALHAVSRDLQAFPHECLYVMVDTKIDEEPDRGDDEALADDESDSAMTEFRFVPEDKGMLDAMFHAMSECQALHPDPQDSFSDDDEIYEDADNDEEEGEYQLGAGDGAIIMNPTGCATSNGVTSGEEPMEMDVGQFEDAEGEPDN